MAPSAEPAVESLPLLAEGTSPHKPRNHRQTFQVIEGHRMLMSRPASMCR